MHQIVPREIAFKNVVNQIANNHYEKFVNHFSDLLEEQIDNFNADEFEDWKERQLHAFELIGKFKSDQDKHRFLIKLKCDGYKYDCLFLSKDILKQDSPIVKTIDYPFLSINDIHDVIKSIENSNMVIVDESRLKTFILLYLSQKFMSYFLPKKNLIKAYRNASKRDTNSNDVVSNKSMVSNDRLIRDSFAVINTEVIKSTSKLWNTLLTSLSPKSTVSKIPVFDNPNLIKCIQIKPKANIDIVYESLVPLILILENNYTILTLDEYLNLHPQDDIETYRKEYLYRRVRLFLKKFKNIL